MKFDKKRSNAKQEIPTSSMPDIIFMLLLFFMVATTLKEVDGCTIPKCIASIGYIHIGC